MDKPNQWLDDTAWDNITELDKYDTIPTHAFSLLFYLFISFLLFHLKFNCMYVYNFSFPCIPCTLVFFFICLFFCHLLSSFHPNLIPFPPGWPALWALPTHLISTPGTGINGSLPLNLRTPHCQVLCSVSVSLEIVIS